MKQHQENLSIIEDDKKFIWHPFTQQKTSPSPIPIKSAKGVFLHTYDNKVIIDYISSWWVNIHGHCHPYISQSIAKQVNELEQVIFAGFTHKPAVELSKKLVSFLPSSITKCFFSDNGSSAIEVAIKMAYQYHHNKDEINRTKIITFDGAYHGDTIGAMSVGKSSGFFKAWDNLMFDVEIIQYPNTHINDPEVDEKEQQALNQLDNLIKENSNEICTLIVEPLVQGASGMRMVRKSFLEKVCQKVRNSGGIVIFDEVMTGFGRTGKMFSCQHLDNFSPDIICLSKGLTAGYMPMSITATNDKIYNAFLDDDFAKSFIHGHSYTANPLGCSAGIASLEVFEKEDRISDISRIEKYHNDVGYKILSSSNHIKNIRICGTIIACDVVVDDCGYTAEIGNQLKEYFWEKGFLIRPLGNVIYLMPPYVITNEELKDGYEIIVKSLSDLLNNNNY